MLLFGTGLNCTLKDQIMSHPALHDALNDPKNGDSAAKHLKQQVCLSHSNSTKNGLFVHLSEANILFFLNIVLMKFCLDYLSWYRISILNNVVQIYIESPWHG